MYDEIWAFALVFNQSIAELTETGANLPLLIKGKGHSYLTSVIEKHFFNTFFAEASGEISFSNGSRAVLAVSKVLQIKNGSPVPIGKYKTTEDSVTLFLEIEFPSDEFEFSYILLPDSLAGTILTVHGLTLLLVTTVLVVTPVFSKSRDMKAFSPFLSILMLVGCYMVIVSDILLTIFSWEVWANEIKNILCYSSK